MLIAQIPLLPPIVVLLPDLIESHDVDRREALGLGTQDRLARLAEAPVEIPFTQRQGISASIRASRLTNLADSGC